MISALQLFPHQDLDNGIAVVAAPWLAATAECCVAAAILSLPWQDHSGAIMARCNQTQQAAPACT